MGEFSDFQRGKIVGVHLAGASVTKTAALLSVPRAAVSKVMMTYTNHWRTSSAKRNSGQKPKLNGRDRRRLKRIVAINIHLEDRFPQNSLMRLSQI
jgi:hypothetical protein